MSNLIGKSLGRYHILEQLGEGGMATVYKAYDTRLETDVAVKVIRTENLTLGTMERTLKRFEREAKSLARLTHPNIVKVTDYGEHEGKPYLVMPNLPGGTLKDRIKQGPIPWQEAVRLLLPIAQALEYAHEQNIIHRDVKPSNILLTSKGQPMLTDFGVAKLFDMDATADLTGTGMGVGTPEYMAPEQWQGQVSAQTDVYALGVVLYEMVTGRRPYTADTPAALLLKQATEPLPRPKSFVPSLPESVEKVLFKALAKRLEARYRDMSAFANALERFNAEKSVVEASSPRRIVRETKTVQDLKPEPATIADNKPVQRTNKYRPHGWIIGVGMACIALIAILIGLWQGGSAAIFPTRMPTATLNPGSTNILSLTSTTPVTIASTKTPLSIGGTTSYIFFWAGRKLYEINANGNNLRMIYDTDQWPSRISWKSRDEFYFNSSSTSYDSLMLATIQNGMISAKVISAGSRQVIHWSRTSQQMALSFSRSIKTTYDFKNFLQIDISNYVSDCITWSPDGVFLALSVIHEAIDPKNDGNIILVERSSIVVVNTKTQYYYKLLSGVSGCLSWSPDGQQIAYSSSDGIFTVNFKNASDKIKLSSVGLNPDWSPDGKWIIFQTDTGLSIINSDGTGERQILAMENVRYPVWQP